MIVTITDIKLNQTGTSAAGATYSFNELHYKNAEGKALKKMIFAKDPIASLLPTVAAGDNLEVKVEKDGKFYKWVEASKTTASPQVYKKPEPSKFTPKSYDNTGAKVGNISNCATTIYAAKLTPSLTSAVDMVLAAHKYIESKLSSDTPTAVAPVATNIATFNVDDGEAF